MDLLDLDRRALELTGAFVLATDPSQLGLPTPCAGWDARALLDHVIGNNHAYAAIAAGRAVDWADRDRDLVGDDHRGAYERSTAEVRDAFAAADLGAQVRLPIGMVTAGQALAVHFVDILVHGWDLAVATGQDATLPDDLAEPAMGIVAAYPPDVWGSPVYFADKVASSPDDPPYVRLVSLLGRRPHQTVV